MLAGRRVRVLGSRFSLPRVAFGWPALIVVLVAAVAFVGLTAAPWRESAGRAEAFPARLLLNVDPGAVDYRQPADAVELAGSVFALDTGNNRIVVQDAGGSVHRVIDGSADGGPLLDAPMSIASDGLYLYVANSGASEVLVLDPEGRVVDTLAVLPDASAGRPPRPVGVAVAPDGAVLVSDPDANRLLLYGPGGDVRVLGGARAAGSEGYNAPTGLAVDGSGSFYVADTLNGRVVKLSPSGELLQQFGRPGDTAGTLARPKDVAVDTAGNVYVSDGLLAAVQVFDATGDYLGFIGRSDPGNARSASLFTAPAGLWVEGDRLYVVDRFAGLFIFDLPK